MHISKFSITELKEQLENISTDSEKIEFISDEVTKCKDAIQDVKYYAANFETTEIKLIIKTSERAAPLTEIISTNEKIKREATRKIIKLCAQKLCDEFADFLERADALLSHYKTKLDAIAKSKELIMQRINPTTLPETMQTKIVWKIGKERLLEMFVQLNLNEMIPKYEKEEVLIHFVDEKRNPFLMICGVAKPINWLDSDSTFAVFVDELAKRGAIEDENKYKTFGKHFINKKGKPFKDLPQKRNYTENFTKSGNLIRKVLDDAKI